MKKNTCEKIKENNEGEMLLNKIISRINRITLFGGSCEIKIEGKNKKPWQPGAIRPWAKLLG